MIYTIERDKIVGAMTEIARALNGKDLNSGEVIIALAEMAGNIITDTTDNHIQCKQLVETVTHHIVRTIATKGRIQGKDLIRLEGE